MVGLEAGVEKLLVMLSPWCVVRLICMLFWLLDCGIVVCEFGFCLYVEGDCVAGFGLVESGVS